MEPFETTGVRGFLHSAESPNGNAILLTHGAGSNAGAPLLVALAEAFAGAGFLVLRYDLPFRTSGRKSPPPPAAQSSDRQGVLRAIDAVRSMTKGRIVAGGHSYGGRQTAMAAAENPDMADGLLLLSYPLHPPDKPQQLRTSFFSQLRTPALFVHGSRDPFGTLAELGDALRLIPAKTDLLAVEKAGHDLKPAARMAETILRRMVF
ncbi:MAG TPA: alpha/beta fold hydrolase [Candidatus Acidoferrales bacterium]|nr:alpha/beta fold hydrolase [Candidatus Acidoferrales bacterium]